MRLPANNKSPGEQAMIAAARRAVSSSAHSCPSRQISGGKAMATSGFTQAPKPTPSPTASSAGQPGGNTAYERGALTQNG